MDQTALRRENGFKDLTTEFRGIISSSAITNADLHAGRYDDAQVDEYLVNWFTPWLGPIISNRYWVDKCNYNNEFWRADLSGRTRFLNHNVGMVLGRTCDRDLGDSGCGVNLSSFTTAGVSVLGTSDGRKRLSIRADPATLSGSFADSYFKYGYVLWTSGANNGLKNEIKSYVSASREITLHVPTAYDIAVGDTFSITAGCDKLSSTCISKFSNILNFRGSKFMPGTDEILKSPTR